MAKTSTPLMFQPLVKYVQFNGRARRSEYWLFFLFQFIVGIIFAAITLIVPAVAGPVDMLNNVFSLAMFLPTIAVSVRRFHDINRTGWWTVFPLVVLIATFIIYAMMNGQAMETAFSSIDMEAVEAGDEQAIMDFFTAVSPMLLWVFLPTWLASLVTFIFHVTDGTKGPNRFGADPKGSSADTSVF